LAGNVKDNEEPVKDTVEDTSAFLDSETNVSVEPNPLSCNFV